jgi:hypothetical protein
MGLTFLGVSGYDFALCFREVLFDAIPANFVSPVTHFQLRAPEPCDEDLPASTAQFHGLHVDLVVIVCQTAARLGLANAHAAVLFRLLRLASLTHVHSVTSFICFETFLRRTMQGRTPDACTRSLAFGVWSASTVQETQLTFQLEAVIEEHLQNSTQVNMVDLAIARFPALSVFTSSCFWASLADANETLAWTFLSTVAPFASASLHLISHEGFHTRALCLCACMTRIRMGESLSLMLSDNATGSACRPNLAEVNPSDHFLKLLSRAAVCHILTFATSLPVHQPGFHPALLCPWFSNALEELRCINFARVLF